VFGNETTLMGPDDSFDDSTVMINGVRNATNLWRLPTTTAGDGGDGDGDGGEADTADLQGSILRISVSAENSFRANLTLEF
jgi:hypothetical protein